MGKQREKIRPRDLNITPKSDVLFGSSSCGGKSNSKEIRQEKKEMTLYLQETIIFFLVTHRKRK